MRKHGPGKQTPPSSAEARTAADPHRYPDDGKAASVDQPCQPNKRRGAQYQVDWDLRIGCSRRIAPRGEHRPPPPIYIK